MLVKCKVGNCNYRDDDTEFCRKAVIMIGLGGCTDFLPKERETIKEQEKEKIRIEEIEE